MEISTSFDPFYFEVLSSSKNGSFHHVRTLQKGTTTITAVYTSVKVVYFHQRNHDLIYPRKSMNRWKSKWCCYYMYLSNFILEVIFGRHYIHVSDLPAHSHFPQWSRSNSLCSVLLALSRSRKGKQVNCPLHIHIANAKVVIIVKCYYRRETCI